MAKVAVVLSGCGVFDGTEIHEAVSVLVHLSRAGATYHCFAPDKPLTTIDHLKGEPAGDTRNVLVESARIARGDIRPLTDLAVGDYDAVIFPGGFGAAKNLCDFATSGADCTVDPDVEQVVKAFHDAGKPVGMCCIAPVIAARVLGTRQGGPGVSVTIGADAGAAEAIGQMGSTNITKPVTEAHIDEQANLITAPAYMYGDASPHEVYEGIGDMVAQTLGRVGAGTA
jgi:enhancing lycopene biosynthesis protein 2